MRAADRTKDTPLKNEIMGSHETKIRELERLNQEILSCMQCPRLINYIRYVSKKKTKRFAKWVYWGRPLHGFGDPDAWLIIIGLAPAAHGGNRTGRMFTGDSSGDWLIRALYEVRIANQPYSISRDDGLTLNGAYITAAVRCAPPKNRPLSGEIRNCLRYLIQEFRILRNAKVYLALGKIAFNSTIWALEEAFGIEIRPRPKFRHHARYFIEDINKWLYVSYHPSRQNTQTGRLSWDMWIEVFKDVCKNFVEKQ